MIEQLILKGLNHKIAHKKKKLPTPNHPDLPPLFFTYASIGMKNSGKSYAVVSLISLYEKYGVTNGQGENMEIRTIWASPTTNMATNTVIKTLKSLHEDDIHENVTEDLLKEIFEEIIAEKEKLLIKYEYIKAYKRFIKLKNPMYLKDVEIMILSQYDYEKPSIVFKGLVDKIYFLVLDDLIGMSNSIFGMKKNNFINSLTIRHRHYGINLIYCVQQIKYLPTIIRANLDIIQLFKSASSKVLESYYEEVSNILTFDEFLQLFQYCIDQKYGSLLINNHQSAPHKFLLNFHTALSVNGKH